MIARLALLAIVPCACGTTDFGHEVPAWSGLTPSETVSERTESRFSVTVTAEDAVLELDEFSFSAEEHWTSDGGDRVQHVLLDEYGWAGRVLSHRHSLAAHLALRQALSTSGPVGDVQIDLDVSYTPVHGERVEWTWTGMRAIDDRLVLEHRGIEVAIVRRR